MPVEFERSGGSKRHRMPPGPQNLVAGLALILLGALALWLTEALPQGTLRAMGPAMLPRWLAIGVGLCGLALIAAAFLREGHALESWSLRGLFFVTLAILAFAVTIRPFALGPVAIPGLGLIVAGPLAIFIAGFASNEARFGELVILSLGLTAFCMVLFGDLLNLPIPLFPQSVAELFPATFTPKQTLRSTAAILTVAAILAYLAERSRGRVRGSSRIDVTDHSGRI